VIFFIVNVIATIAAVAVNSFGTRWFGGWLPAGYTARWYVGELRGRTAVRAVPRLDD